MSDVRMTWDGRRVSANVAKAGIRGLQDGAEHLLTTANQTVPKEEGHLERSGIVEVDEERLASYVGYGSGPASPYALKQHEDTTLRHDPGRRAKWLELALDEERERIQKRIEKSLREAFR